MELKQDMFSNSMKPDNNRSIGHQAFNLLAMRKDSSRDKNQSVGAAARYVLDVCTASNINRTKAAAANCPLHEDKQCSEVHSLKCLQH